MSEPSESAAEPNRKASRSLIRWGPALAILAIGLTALLFFGQRLWTQVQGYLESRQAAEDSVPVGYLGVHLRRSYHDRPAVFLSEADGRKRLWAAKGEDGKAIYYDVTDATIRVESLSGGFGRDSNPGIDYPIFEGIDSERSARLRDNQEFYGLTFEDGPRAYPAELLKKIEVVDDLDGSTPFAIVYDRSLGAAKFYERTLGGREVTFGTTGYAYGTNSDPSLGKPLLYDRRTKSLWLPEADGLVCVSGELKGTKLGLFRELEATTWSSWKTSHPQTRILVGSDRTRPIPSE
ncbi:DUF3179 domain-containing (seleno)protein [Tundrisphaera lichenicola]|uniref:DUF3179 domain-containing (seleno)protein n=1 Tax=Tundrisphaera lichenicola TaxID=2029860 RepID=UPI003EBCA8E8